MSGQDILNIEKLFQPYADKYKLRRSTEGSNIYDIRWLSTNYKSIIVSIKSTQLINYDLSKFNLDLKKSGYQTKFEKEKTSVQYWNNIAWTIDLDKIYTNYDIIIFGKLRHIKGF